MEAAERRLVLEHLNGSRERLLGLLAGLSAEQREFRPAESRWSVVDCVEHIVVVENRVFSTLQRVLEAPPEPAKQAEVRGKDQIILNAVPARNERVHGPSAVQPQRRWPDFGELLQQFETARDRTIQFANGCEGDLRSHFFPHPLLGDFDCYQWLLFLATHCERHVRQMEEVMADPGFPSFTVGATSAP